MQVFEFLAMMRGLPMICLGAVAESKGFYVRMAFHDVQCMSERLSA
jgi:hypothetical protein